jgi:hypothetical protein
MWRVISGPWVGVIGACALLVLPAPCQSFSGGTGLLPTQNDGFSENVEFLDADLDGDYDAVIANGGSFGNERNRLWINQGGAQGGLLGHFEDDTAARLPMVKDSSRDVDFVDLERDGDLDLFVSNSSGISNQTNRWWVNQGGAQGGSAGYFVEQTALRWSNVGVNDGTTSFSSVAPSLVLPTGGFVDWSCDSAFADLDGDGDADLVQSTYGATSSGKVPTRVFLNDGSGVFEEFNPSGFQLSGTDITWGDPALWCEGVHKQQTTNSSGLEADIAHDTLSVELGDLDGDYDVDLLSGEKFQQPRIYHNRLAETGALGFRDVSYAVLQPVWAPGPGNYEQELGDLDADGDLDIYGVNWNHIDDALFLNQGDGTFAVQVLVPGSARMNEADWIDFDADGDLDVFIVGEEAAHQVMVNPGAAGSWALAYDPSVVPNLGYTPAHGGDVCDTDGDGDFDYLAACRHDEQNRLYLNVTELPDASAPRIPRVELAPDRTAGPLPTVVRAHVYDNAAWDRVATYAVRLAYTVDGGDAVSLSMTWSGGQVFRAELPGSIVGVVSYAVAASDDWGNTGVSALAGYTASGCSAPVTSYCTAGVTASGCRATLSATGYPSPSAPSGFTVVGTSVEGKKDGIFFYGFEGGQANPWGNGTSFQCVVPPVVRMPLLKGTGSQFACNGVLQRDLNAFWWSAPASSVPQPGQDVSIQLWFRDPWNTSSAKTSLSDALSFVVCP